MSRAADIEHGVLALGEQLGCFATLKAGELAEQLGFGWAPLPKAPSNFRQVVEAFSISVSTGQPFPVSDLYCEDTIYPRPESSWAFRLWHDMTHVHLSADFSLAGELSVSLDQIRAFRSAGYEQPTAEYQLLQADTIGQTLCFDRTGHFPVNQLLFAARCLEHGIASAIELERVDLTLTAPLQDSR